MSGGPSAEPDALVAGVLSGDVRVTARLLRMLDDGVPGAREALAALYPRGGRAVVLGVTGQPGSGKSTLVSQMTRLLRGQGKTVGVVAVDPSSPFTGGAILGDRVRMQEHATDPGVFIRSLASRGHLGGLSRSAADVALVLDAMGRDVVIVETVGVGQDEVEVARLARTTIVVVVPGLGDEIQAFKAGLLEIADVLALNKADRPGADRLEHELGTLASTRPATQGDWDPPVVRTVATSGEGVEELLAQCERHGTYQAGRPDAEARATQRALDELRVALQERLWIRLERQLRAAPSKDLETLAGRLLRRERDPVQLAEEALDRLLAGLPPDGD